MSTTPLPGHVTREMRAFARQAGRRRRLETTIHVGDLAGRRTLITEEAWYDDAIRLDLVSRAVEGVDATPYVWITRGGQLVDDLMDRRWLAAARAAFASHGCALAHFFVITRFGWADLVSGQRHEWARVRQSVDQV